MFGGTWGWEKLNHLPQSTQTTGGRARMRSRSRASSPCSPSQPCPHHIELHIYPRLASQWAHVLRFPVYKASSQSLKNDSSGELGREEREAHSPVYLADCSPPAIWQLWSWSQNKPWELQGGCLRTGCVFGSTILWLRSTPWLPQHWRKSSPQSIPMEAVVPGCLSVQTSSIFCATTVGRVE